MKIIKLFQIVHKFPVKKPVVTLDSNKSNVVFGGMNSNINLVSFS